MNHEIIGKISIIKPKNKSFIAIIISFLIGLLFMIFFFTLDSAMKPLFLIIGIIFISLFLVSLIMKLLNHNKEKPPEEIIIYDMYNHIFKVFTSANKIIKINIDDVFKVNKLSCSTINDSGKIIFILKTDNDETIDFKSFMISDVTNAHKKINEIIKKNKSKKSK